MPVPNRQRKTRRPGQVLAELPVMLICLIFGFTIPLFVFATLGYRAVLLWVATRAACQVAAKASTYHNAVIAANSALAAQTNKNGNIAVTSSTLYSVCEPTGGGAFTAVAGPITSGTGFPISTSNYVYFVRLSVNGVIQPLFPDTAFLGSGNVPGLTSGIPLSIASENFFESPNGLTTGP